MNTQQARARVAETFPQAFNRTKFLEFSRNLLNKFDESKAQAWSATYVKDAFKPHVARFERLGTYTSIATTSPSTKPSRWKRKWPLTPRCSARSLKT